MQPPVLDELKCATMQAIVEWDAPVRRTTFVQFRDREGNALRLAIPPASAAAAVAIDSIVRRLLAAHGATRFFLTTTLGSPKTIASVCVSRRADGQRTGCCLIAQEVQVAPRQSRLHFTPAGLDQCDERIIDLLPAEAVVVETPDELTDGVLPFARSLLTLERLDDQARPLAH
ncbi:MAG: hypothetical protein AAFQ42_14560 [Pseudomonadota bacterium]